MKEGNHAVTCTGCPMGCLITVTVLEGRIEKIEGYGCRRGLSYAENEMIRPARLLTTSVRLSGGREPLLPVRSREPLPKELLFACMDVLKEVSVQTPVACGDVVVKDILGTGIDMIASTDGE